jgi:hypothetical protein
LFRRLLLLVALFSLLVPVAISAQEAECTVSSDAEQYAQFLSTRYMIDFDETVSQDDFISALESIAPGADVSEMDMEGFSNLEAVTYTLYYANMDELAFTYPEDKASAVLTAWGSVPDELSSAQQSELSAAIDVGLLEANCAGLDLEGDVSGDVANYLLGRLLVLSGQYEYALGMVSDADIYNRVYYTYNSFDQVLMPELQASANDLIRQGVITGYNVKRSTANAIFDPELTITYGHSNIAHAIQLIGLLRSEGLDAQVLLEPKTSAFLYLAEWGEPSPSPEFQVEPLDDGNYIAYAKEFDIAFEFATAEDKLRFDEVIKTYAKRNSEDQTGLILGSWWQPLYYATVDVEDYIPVKNNVAAMGPIYLQSFSLTEDSEQVAASFAEAFTDAEVSTSDLWVNQAFHNYLMGEST